jgi:hypothetical protein
MAGRATLIGTCMPNRYHLIAVLILFASSMIAVSARAQSASEPRKAIEGNNPLLPQRMQVAFSGSGSATFTPRNFNRSMPGPTPAPNCTPTITQVGFNVQCLSDPDSKSASTCRGSMSFYGFNETRNIVGEVMATAGDAYSMKLRSPDDDIQGCELSNLAPVSSGLGNVIAMPGCGLNITGCAGEAVGSGANHVLTTSGSVILTPSE